MKNALYMRINSSESSGVEGGGLGDWTFSGITYFIVAIKVTYRNWTISPWSAFPMLPLSHLPPPCTGLSMSVFKNVMISISSHVMCNSIRQSGGSRIWDRERSDRARARLRKGWGWEEVPFPRCEALLF